MQTNNEKGHMLCIIMGAYFVAKAVLNMVIGGGSMLCLQSDVKENFANNLNIN